MNVSDILKRKRAGIITIKPTDTVADLSQVLKENRIGAVVVSADGNTIDGFVTERDLAYSLCVHKSGLHALPVSSIMADSVISCEPGDDVVKVASHMHARHVRHIPVVSDGRAIGMISIRDLLNIRVEEMNQETAMLRGAFNRGPTEPQDR